MSFDRVLISMLKLWSPFLLGCSFKTRFGAKSIGFRVFLSCSFCISSLISLSCSFFQMTMLFFSLSLNLCMTYDSQCYLIPKKNLQKNAKNEVPKFCICEHLTHSPRIQSCQCNILLSVHLLQYFIHIHRNTHTLTHTHIDTFFNSIGFFYDLHVLL